MTRSSRIPGSQLQPASMPGVASYTPEDDYFGAPYIDLDEWREAPHLHRYVHGGFARTETRFSFYFPPAEHYAGRFFSSLEGGVGGHETRAAQLTGDGLATIGFAFANGAYLVESNNGHIAVGPAISRGTQHGSITTYRATAESARFARHLATAMYGARPEHGYIFGPSGGGWRTILCMENTVGIWDGGAPHISPAGNGISFPCAVGNLMRVLGADVSRVVDAWEPGGSGNPFEGLSTRQRQELATLYRAGLQPGAEFQLLAPAFELAVLLLTSRMSADFDPGYFSDFWELPGYAGADGELDTDIVGELTQVVEVLSAADLLAIDPGAAVVIAPETGTVDASAPVAVRVDSPRAAAARGAKVEIREGIAAGRSHRCVGALDDVLVLDFTRVPVSDIAPGDVLALDNRDYLAYCHAYRHQLDVCSLDCQQFLSGTTPIFPQRALGVPDLLAGMPTTGRFEGKMIYLANLMDTLASPIGGTMTYIGRAREQLEDRVEDRLRVWLNDNAGHLSPARRPPGPAPVASTRLVEYDGSVEHAVRALIGWVEDGIEPPADTRFGYEDGRITLAADASERRGIQPVVSATANGARATVTRVGEPVRLEVSVTVPPGAGTVVAAEWDFEGAGTWEHRYALDGTQEQFEAGLDHAYERPGVYFACARAASHSAGEIAARDSKVLNLARVRVEVVPADQEPLSLAANDGSTSPAAS